MTSADEKGMLGKSYQVSESVVLALVLLTYVSGAIFRYSHIRQHWGCMKRCVTPIYYLVS